MIDDLYFRSVSVLSHPFVTQYCSIAFFGREYLLFPFSDITLHAFQIGQLHCALHILSSEVLTTPICSVSGASSPLFVNKPICTITLPLRIGAVLDEMTSLAAESAIVVVGVLF